MLPDVSDHTNGTPARRAVMADVAKLAGVSHQTVSRVLNDADHVRPATRDRVRHAMAMLEYQPNSVARALVTGRSRTLGVVSFDTTLYGPASTLLGIERAAHEHGYFVSIVSMTTLDRASMGSAIERLHRQGVDGILIIAPLVEAVQALPGLGAEVPVVALEAGPEQQLPVVDVDQEAGARAATEHLLALGHATVHHIAGPTSFLESRQRLRGWRASLEAAGARVVAPLVGDWSARSGYELGRELLDGSGAAGPAPTAVFVANDQMALGLLRAAHESGCTLPQDLSVVGFDDIPEAAYFTPPLTTVRQDFAEVGQRALHLMLQRIADPAGPSTHETVPPELVLRASTGAPASG
jgi:DNA-binding LacI/PurR family transcriptional regulator